MKSINYPTNDYKTNLIQAGETNTAITVLHKTLRVANIFELI